MESNVIFVEKGDGIVVKFYKALTDAQYRRAIDILSSRGPLVLDHEDEVVLRSFVRIFSKGV